MAELLGVAGEAALNQMYWASGAMNSHPQPGLDGLIDFQFSEDQMERHGIFFPIPQLTREHKRALLCDNIARLHGFDVEALAAGIKDDEFSSTANGELPTPYSTTALADAVKTPLPGRKDVGLGLPTG
jgi:hypothetical protein